MCNVLRSEIYVSGLLENYAFVSDIFVSLYQFIIQVNQSVILIIYLFTSKIKHACIYVEIMESLRLGLKETLLKPPNN